MINVGTTGLIVKSLPTNLLSNMAKRKTLWTKPNVPKTYKAKTLLKQLYIDHMREREGEGEPNSFQKL